MTPIASLTQAILDCSTLPHDELVKQFSEHVADRHNERDFALALDRVAKAMHEWWAG